MLNDVLPVPRISLAGPHPVKRRTPPWPYGITSIFGFSMYAGALGYTTARRLASLQSEWLER